MNDDRGGRHGPGGRGRPGRPRERGHGSRGTGAGRREAGPQPGRLRRDAPPRPDLPTDEQPQLPKGVVSEIRRQVGARDRADEVALAASIGAAAIDEGLLDVAREHLVWAKHHVPRVGAVREALGVACYLAEDYRAARTELQAYRRLTGRNDQNHVLADCERATASGDRRATARIAELVESMEADAEVDAQRRAEGMIVWASALCDAGEVAAGRAVLRRELERRRTGDPDEATRRVWYVAADLAERAGDVEAARGLFARIVADDDAFHDATQRLEALSPPR